MPRAESESLVTSFVTRGARARYSPRHVLDCHPDPARRARGRGSRRGVGGAAAARPPRLRLPLRRHRAARPAARALRRDGRRPVSACTSSTARCSAPSYANVAPSLPVPAALRGPLAGLAEHLATWPGAAVVDRVHPARSDMPQLWGSGARVRAGRLAPRAVRLRAGRAGAAAQPAGGDRAAGRRRDRLDQRARLGRARGHAGPGQALSRRVLITGASGFAGGHLVAACAAAGDEVVALSRSGGAGGRRRRRPPGRGGRARGDRGGGAGRRLPPRRARARRPLVERSGGDARAQPGDRPQRARGGADRGAGGACWSPSRPARSTARRRALPVDEAAPLRPQNPYAVSKAAGDLLAGLLRRRARAARRAPARVQPRRAGPAAALRARIVHAPGRGRARGGRRPGPARDRQPGRAARLHRRARRRARLPAARRGRRAGRVQRLLGPLGVAARAAGRARARPPASRSRTRSTRRSCARTR